MSDEGVKHALEWKQKGGGSLVNRFQMSLSDKLKEQDMMVFWTWLSHGNKSLLNQWKTPQNVKFVHMQKCHTLIRQN